MASLFSSPEVKRFLELTERGLRKFMDSDVALMLEVGNYIMDGGGKRLRPVLTMAVARAGGIGEELLEKNVVPLAVGIEYIHTASLLHDDIVDDAETRRGKKAAHKVFGNAVAVLTGDYMYANALYLYSVYGNQTMIKVVSEAVKMMSEGQLLEIKKVGELIDEIEYFEIIDGKTSALFGSSAAVGALASEDFREAYHDWWNFGLYIGRAFQLIDDALDYEGDEKSLGKPAGQDLKEGKVTYPLLAVVDKLDKELLKKAILDGDEEAIREVVEKVKELGGVELTKERARVELNKARFVLEKYELKNGMDRFLNELVDFIVERTY